MADDDIKNVSENKNSKDGGKRETKPAKASKGARESINIRLTKWFTAKKNEYWAEFKRIVWPTREQLLKETVTVMAVSLIFGLYVAALDGIFGMLFSRFAQLTSSLFS